MWIWRRRCSPHRLCWPNRVSKLAQRARPQRRTIWTGSGTIFSLAIRLCTSPRRHTKKEITQTLIAEGAHVRARNRRAAEPLHAAAVGMPGSQTWNPQAQAATIVCLIAAGADPNACDKDGATPLHRAVRTRCAEAVRGLLDGGADAERKNKSGSTPMRLAGLNTGRGGTGSPEAKAQQQEILRLLEQHGARP
jgi:Ankyrin repeats (many copies)